MFDEPFLRRLERLSLLSRRAMVGQLQGERRSPKRGQSVEFADFRAYAPGDDFRRIDWNAYARLERFFLKLFVEEEDLTVHILVDTSRSMDWGEPNKLWYALRAAGALGYVALTGLDRVTVSALGMERWPPMAPGGGPIRHARETALPRTGTAQQERAGYWPPRRGKQQAFDLFRFLSAIEANGVVDLGGTLSRYAAQTHRPGPLIVLSDLFDTASLSPRANGGLSPRVDGGLSPRVDGGLSPRVDGGLTGGLNALAARGFEITVLHILAPEEVHPELAGDLKLVDVETGEEVEITADYDLLARYRSSLVAWREELGRFCAARGMNYVPVDTSLPFEQLLFALLRSRGVLK